MLFVVQKSDGGGLTVYPEVGVYVTVDDVTGQCRVSYEPDAEHDVSEITHSTVIGQ